MGRYAVKLAAAFFTIAIYLLAIKNGPFKSAICCTESSELSGNNLALEDETFDVSPDEKGASPFAILGSFHFSSLVDDGLSLPLWFNSFLSLFSRAIYCGARSPPVQLVSVF